MSARPDLRIIDGEVPEGAPQTLAEALVVIEELDAELQKQTTDARSWHRRYLNLKRDKQAEAESDTLWGKAVALFYEWRIATGHMRSQWSADRFFLCRPYIEHDGLAICRLSVWGIAAHPNTREITPGYAEVYDDFELVFRNRATFERYARRGWAIFGRECPQDAPLADTVTKWQQSH